MEAQIQPWLLGLAALTTGVMAGIYFAFSAFIIKALQALPGEIGVAAMNSINRVILQSAFIPLFFASSALALLLILWPPTTAPVLTVSAGVIYLVGMLLCTVVKNIPLNKRLQSATAAKRSQQWQHYLVYWLRWNHSRTLSSLLACALYLTALTPPL